MVEEKNFIFIVLLGPHPAALVTYQGLQNYSKWLYHYFNNYVLRMNWAIFDTPLKIGICIKINYICMGRYHMLVGMWFRRGRRTCKFVNRAKQVLQPLIGTLHLFIAFICILRLLNQSTDCFQERYKYTYTKFRGRGWDVTATPLWLRADQIISPWISR